MSEGLVISLTVVIDDLAATAATADAVQKAMTTAAGALLGCGVSTTLSLTPTRDEDEDVERV